jgi:chaperonin GroES
MAKKRHPFRPVLDQILVQPEAMDDKTPGGIALPDQSKPNLPRRGRVLAVGPGKRDPNTGRTFDMGIEVGDLILYRHVGANDIVLQGETLQITSEGYLLGILEDFER